MKLLTTLVFIFILGRALLPSVLLRETNKFLANFSDTYVGHLEDFDISVFRGAYILEGFSLKLKKSLKEEFVFAKTIDVSIAWRELFEGRLNTDIYLDNVNIVLTNNFLDTVSSKKQQSQRESESATKKLFPVRIGRIDVKNSSFVFAELLSIPEKQRWRMSEIEGRLSNITATASSPLSFFSARGKLFESSTVKLVSQLNLIRKPIIWNADIELKDFNLPNANDWLKQKIPLTFTSGKLNVYSEVRSKNNSIEGYVKPFLHKADVVAQPEVFSNLKQFAIEVSLGSANLILRSARDKVLATKIPFSYSKGDFKLNSSEALSKAIQNGFSEKIPEGIDDEINLSSGDMNISKREH